MKIHFSLKGFGDNLDFKSFIKTIGIGWALNLLFDYYELGIKVI